MKKAKFIYTILVVLMVVTTGIQKVSAQVLHNVVVPKGDNLPVKDEMYAQAAKGELKGYYYGGNKGYDRKIEMSRYLFNFSDNLRNFKTLPIMNGKHPVTQIQYVDAKGKFVEKDTITAEGAIMILSDYNLAYGYDADFPGDSISAAFCHEDGTYDFRTRAVRPGEKRRMVAGVTLYSKGPKGCGNDVDLPAEKLGNSERTGGDGITNTPAKTDPMVFNAGGPNGATAKINIDSVLLANNARGGGNIIILPAVVNAEGGSSSVVNSGNPSSAPAADQGSFQKVEYQDVVNHGYDNVPYVYNAQYYQFQQPGQQPQYVYRSGNQWLYAAGGFAVGVVVGALLDNLFMTCNNNNATGCGYGYNGSGGVVVNNYNYNNNTVNTGGNPPPPSSGGVPTNVDNGPALGNTGAPQATGNRTAYVYQQPSGNAQSGQVQGGRSNPNQSNGQGYTNQPSAQQAAPAVRGGTNASIAQPAPVMQPRPAIRPASAAPTTVVVRGGNVPRGR